MKNSELIRRGYRWEGKSNGWKVFYCGKVIGEGSESNGLCKHPKAREHRKMLNRAAARIFAKVDFVKRRVSGE